MAASMAVTAWTVVRRSNVCSPRPPASRSAKAACTWRSTFLRSAIDLPTTRGPASSRVRVILSPPGTSPTPVAPVESVRTTTLRVK